MRRQVCKMNGTAILIGFITMFAIDEIVKMLGHREPEAKIEDKSSKGKKKAKTYESKSNKTVMMTAIALCVHSMTEGVATGASLYSKSEPTNF